MAAYAALVCLNFTLDQIPDSILRNNPQIESLKEKINFLLEFLEFTSQRCSNGIEVLEKTITLLCRVVEDVVESYVVVQLHKQTEEDRRRSSALFYEDLQKVMEEFDSIKEKAMNILDDEANENQWSTSSAPGVLLRSDPSGENNMVGFDKHFDRIMGRIMSKQSNLQILPIVGMGGIGKTTLTHNVYDNQNVMKKFDIRLWITVSQSYNVQDILVSLLHGIPDQVNEDEASSISKTSLEDHNELGDKLYKALLYRRYLIVMDDVWSIEVWYMLRRFFPNNGNHSRIIVTTRLSKMASDIGSGDPYTLDLLDEDNSWSLLKQKLFPDHDCPSILEDIGRKIAVSCRGLPLAIVVIGGQLAKSDITEESWSRVRGAINSIINTEDDNRCLKILSLSYDNLPLYLKPCFLSMAVFPEDFEVRVSKLVRLWVTEGFLKPVKDKCLEDTAVEYLKDLVQRNLILVSKRGSSGKMKCCRIHDLLRDLCLRKAHEQRFLCIKRFSSFHIPHVTETEPNINMQPNIKQHRHHPKILKPLRSTTVRITCLNLASMSALNSRCLTLAKSWFYSMSSFLPSLVSLAMFWNLQTLIMSNESERPIVLPSQIWEMSLLRHVEITPQVILPDPPTPNVEANFKGREHYVLKNLHTLLTVHNLNLRDEVVSRIPNIRKLKIHSGSLDDLSQLCKLESLSCTTAEKKKISILRLSFPQSLKKLTLDGGGIPWKDMTVVGSLPNLEVLKLKNHAFCGREWRPMEGEFCRLKSLYIANVYLEHWDADSLHFPRLERLILHDVEGLWEIPLGIGDIETLQFVSLRTSCSHLARSAKQLQEHQESTGNSDITFHVMTMSTWYGIGSFLYFDEEDYLLNRRMLFGTYRQCQSPYRKLFRTPKLEIPNMKLEISEARDEVLEKLDEDIDLFRAFYSDSIVKRRQQKLVSQIKDVVDEAEKIIDAFDMMYRKLGDISVNDYEDNKNSIAREFKAISLRVQDIYGNVEFNMAYKHWLQTWEPQIRSTSMEDINKQNALKAGQKTERSQGRRLQSPRQIQRQNKARIRSSPQCRWR